MSKNKPSFPCNPSKPFSDTDPVGSMLQNAHGRVLYNMTNDYMFRAVLQSNNKVLRGLICSLLHLHEKDVHSVEITNPIILGESIHNKEIRLDINVHLNNRGIINLEMQISNRFNWPNRSLLYLSRSFDNLNHGDGYPEIKPAVHIGFLDYTLFDGQPEFYATYKMLNVKNHQIYNDNFVLSVIDLTRIDLATEEDKKYHIDDWARLFKAATWEEIKKMANQNEYLEAASKSIFLYNTDEQIKKMCRDRMEYYQDLRNYERHFAKQEAIIAEKESIIAEKNNALSEKDIIIAEKDNTITDLLAQIQKLTDDKGKQG